MIGFAAVASLAGRLRPALPRCEAGTRRAGGRGGGDRRGRRAPARSRSAASSRRRRRRSRLAAHAAGRRRRSRRRHERGRLVARSGPSPACAPGPLRGALVVDCRPPVSVANFDVAWGLGPDVAAIDPTAIAMDATSDTEASRIVEAARTGRSSSSVRGAAAHRWQQRLVDRIRVERPDAIVVDLGWPRPTRPDRATLTTWGASAKLDPRRRRVLVGSRAADQPQARAPSEVVDAPRRRVSSPDVGCRRRATVVVERASSASRARRSRTGDGVEAVVDRVGDRVREPRAAPAARHARLLDLADAADLLEQPLATASRRGQGCRRARSSSSACCAARRGTCWRSGGPRRGCAGA